MEGREFEEKRLKRQKRQRGGALISHRDILSSTPYLDLTPSISMLFQSQVFNCMSSHHDIGAIPITVQPLATQRSEKRGFRLTT